MGNIITAYLGPCPTATTEKRYQYDQGQILMFAGVSLPTAYEVDFSNNPRTGDSKTQIGTADEGVAIPDEYFKSGKPVYAFVVLTDGDGVTTEYRIEIPVIARPARTDDEPTPEEQSAIDQAIAALNSAVESTNAAQTAAETAQQGAEEAKDAAVAAAENADTSADNVAQSAADAAQSAANAATSAQNAAASAQRASGSAMGANSAATSASSSASAAAQQVTNAAGYASQAAASASAAANSATEAANIVTGVEDDAQAAANSARAAAASESSASAAATDATEARADAQTYAGAASDSANNAAVSAQAAAGSASAASASASAAAGDATAAADSASAAAQTLANVNAAGAAQISAIDAEGSTQTAAVTAEGQRVLGTIPADYTDLSDQVSDLKNQVSILSSFHKADLSYADIAKIVKAGLAPEWFEIGDQIITTWNDGTHEYEMPWDVVDIAPVVNADGDTVPGLWLESHWALPGLQFDASEALYYTAEGLPAGTYHFTIGTKWGTHCVAGTSYQFTLAEPVPAGGQICVANNTNFYTWGAPDVAPANWKIYTFSAFDITPIEGPVALAEGADGTDLGTTTTAIVYDTATGINNLYRAGYGYSRDSQSAMLQWLNSGAAVSGWQMQKNPFDRPAQQHATMRGFMAGLPSDFLNIVNPVRVTTALNNWSDKNIGTSESYNARFFLASLEQEYIVPQLAGVEGVYWPYWKDRLGLDTPQVTGSGGANVNHIRYGIENHATASYVRLRSASRGTAGVWNVLTSGGAYSDYAASTYRPAPACVIC